MSEQSKVALITGAGRRRVGQVVAESLATDGYKLGLHYLASSETAQEARERLVDQGTECEVFEADVRVEADVDRMIDEVVDHFGRLDVLVTTASIWATVPLEELTAEELTRNFEVNTLGTFLCARTAGMVMVSQPEGGSIITIGDWAIERPYLHHAAYFVSKGAIPTLTRTLAVELASRNPKVRVNCIHPGPVMFPPDATPSEQQEMIESTLVKTANCPSAIAKAVKFFNENSFVTGTCIPIDGGRSIFAAESSSRGRPI